jgi:hypothetical protein
VEVVAASRDTEEQARIKVAKRRPDLNYLKYNIVRYPFKDVSRGGIRYRTSIEFTCSNCSDPTFRYHAVCDINDLKTTLCEICRKEKHQKNLRLKPFETKYNRLVYNAKRRNLDCGLTYQDYLCYTYQSCHYCNEKIPWEPYNDPDRNSLDRMDNTKGYFKENCVVSCFSCNEMKSNKYTYEEFMLLSPALKQIQQNRKNINC